MIQVVTVQPGRGEQIFEVPDGVRLQVDPQDPSGGWRVLRVFDHSGELVAVFADWRAAMVINESGSTEIGFNRRMAAAMAAAKENA